MRSLKRDARGYPIFYAIQPSEGFEEGDRVDFRVLNYAHHLAVAQQRLCAVCGKKLGSRLHWIGGPMCVLNRVFGDGPMHLECARYAMAVCPYLSIPTKQYRLYDREGEVAFSEEVQDPNVILAKPRMMVLAATGDYHLIHGGPGKHLFLLPRWMDVEWYSNDGHYVGRTRPDTFAQ